MTYFLLIFFFYVLQEKVNKGKKMIEKKEREERKERVKRLFFERRRKRNKEKRELLKVFSNKVASGGVFLSSEGKTLLSSLFSSFKFDPNKCDDCGSLLSLLNVSCICQFCEKRVCCKCLVRGKRREKKYFETIGNKKGKEEFLLCKKDCNVLLEKLEVGTRWRLLKEEREAIYEPLNSLHSSISCLKQQVSLSLSSYLSLTSSLLQRFPLFSFHSSLSTPNPNSSLNPLTSSSSSSSSSSENSSNPFTQQFFQIFSRKVTTNKTTVERDTTNTKLNKEEKGKERQRVELVVGDCSEEHEQALQLEQLLIKQFSQLKTLFSKLKKYEKREIESEANKVRFDCGKLMGEKRIVEMMISSLSSFLSHNSSLFNERRVELREREHSLLLFLFYNFTKLCFEVSGNKELWESKRLIFQDMQKMMEGEVMETAMKKGEEWVQVKKRMLENLHTKDETFLLLPSSSHAQKQSHTLILTNLSSLLLALLNQLKFLTSPNVFQITKNSLQACVEFINESISSLSSFN